MSTLAKSFPKSFAKSFAKSLLALSVLLGPAWAQTSPSGTGAATPAAKPLPTGACRVKDRAGGRTCTADVPESACIAISKEAKGTYTWTQEQCP